VSTLLAKLSEQQNVLEKQARVSTESERSPADSKFGKLTPDSSSSGISVDEKIRTFVSKISQSESSQSDIDEVERLKKELTAAKQKLAKQEQELTKSDVYNSLMGKTNRNIGCTRQTFSNGVASIFHHDDVKSEISGSVSSAITSRPTSIWDSSFRSTVTSNLQQGNNIWSLDANKSWPTKPMMPALSPLLSGQTNQSLHPFSGPPSPGSSDGQYPSFSSAPFGGVRRLNNNNTGTRHIHSLAPSLVPGRANIWNNPWNSGEISTGYPMAPGSYQSTGGFQAAHNYQPRPIGSSALSPTAAEFTLNGGNNTWGSTVSSFRMRRNTLTRSDRH
jgi:hypothetical protein